MGVGVARSLQGHQYQSIAELERSIWPSIGLYGLHALDWGRGFEPRFRSQQTSQDSGRILASARPQFGINSMLQVRKNVHEI